jgi:predicted Na+-dependent transporter
MCVYIYLRIILLLSDLRLEISRDKAQLNAGINIGFTAILIVALFFMGLEIDLKLVLKVLKRPIGPTIGMVCQFLFMPICAFALGELLLIEGKHPGKVTLDQMTFLLYTTLKV